MPDDRPQPGEVYFEFTAIGRNVKVAAIDAATGTEVSVDGAGHRLAGATCSGWRCRSSGEA